LHRRERFAVAAVFALHGLAAGAWASRIPWVKEMRHLSAAGLGLALSGAAIGGLAAMPLASWLISRLGSRTVTRAAVLVTAASLAPPAFAPGRATIFLALAAFGAAGSVLDVAMNSQGVVVQGHYGRSIMSGFHGVWSLGGLAGAAIGGLAARAGVGAPANLVAVAIAVGVAGSLSGAWLTPSPPSPTGRVFARPDRALFLLGVVTFCGLFAEAAANDWSAVYMRSATHASQAVAATGYTAFALAMAAGRLSGDRLVDRFGPVRLVRAAALTGACGLALGLLAPFTGVVLASFALLGLGIATVVPLTFSAAGRIPAHDPGTAVAAVATVGYGGWMIAPPVVGFVAQGTSLTVALAAVAAMTALIAPAAVGLRGTG
jgi:MFS family permease